MARVIRRGDIWLCDLPSPDKRRPVLVLTRDSAVLALHRVVVAPVTSTMRGLPSEVALGVAEGLKAPCVANLDHVTSVSKAALSVWVGAASDQTMQQACAALAFALACSDGR